jgi:hypothetical protein
MQLFAFFYKLVSNGLGFQVKICRIFNFLKALYVELTTKTTNLKL